MRLIDEQYTKIPVYGIRRMTIWLKTQGHCVNPKRVGRLMRLMGLEAIYPKPKLSLKDALHKIYPYLLKGLKIIRPDQVWSTDITYIRMQRGFVYLVAMMDWYSRYVISWKISITMEADFCIEALEQALRISKLDIFNSDQGSQFTCTDFTKVLLQAGISISMDSKGRVFDNIFIERLWRTVKYEEIYLHEYANVRELQEKLKSYFRFYNEERPHQAMGYKTPQEVYRQRN
jgi:putative transposase